MIERYTIKFGADREPGEGSTQRKQTRPPSQACTTGMHNIKVRIEVVGDLENLKLEESSALAL